MKRAWKWFGHPAHFIAGDHCRFHLATKVGKYLVSTVGEYRPQSWPKDNRGWDTIGCDRKYETMVFKAGAPCKEKGCSCGLPDISGSELDFLGYNDARAATQGHYKLCAKWGAK